MLKKAAVIGVAGLALGVSPASAGSLGNGSTVALTMIGGGGAMAIGCMVTALMTQDDEDDQEGYDRRGIYLGLSGSYARQNFSDSSVADLVGGELQENLRLLRGTPVNGDIFTNPPGDVGVYNFESDDIDDDAFGYMGRAGYRCHPYFSTELQFEGLADFDGSIAETEAPPANDVARKFDLELESLVFTTNVKGHLLTGRTQPFVLMGLGFMRMESKARDTTPASNPRPTTPVATAKCKPNLADPCLAGQATDITVEFAMRLGGGLDFYLTESVVMSAEASYLMPTGSLDGLDYYVFSLGLQYRF